MVANSKDLAKFTNFDRKAASGEVKRPDHPDFMTASELAAMKFSGTRGNSLTQDVECWVQGEKVFFATAIESHLDPMAFTKKYVEYFGMNPP